MLSGLLRGIFTSDFPVALLLIVMSIVVAAVNVISLSEQSRVTFDRAARKVIWERLCMGDRTIIVRDFGEIDGIVLPRQGLVFPTPPFFAAG